MSSRAIRLDPAVSTTHFDWSAEAAWPSGELEPEPMPTYRPASMTLLYIWIALFGFVGTQLAWTLRPFFGNPDKPFEPFRHLEGTFYADIFRTIGHLFGN